MALTFTQVPVILRVNKEALLGVIEVLDLINKDNPNKIYTIDTSFHVGSVEAADTVEAGLDVLKNLGAIDAYQWGNVFNQIKGFRRNYLK